MVTAATEITLRERTDRQYITSSGAIMGGTVSFEPAIIRVVPFPVNLGDIIKHMDDRL